jgi:hypothetical protein
MAVDVFDLAAEQAFEDDDACFRQAAPGSGGRQP